MGDRTFVSLRIWGDVKKGEDLDALNKAIEDEGPTEDYIPAGWRYLSFEEVNYGEIRDVLAELERIGLCYEQHWDAGDGYAAGCYVYSAALGKHEFATNDGEIVIPVRDDAEAELAAAREVIAAMAAFPPYREVEEAAPTDEPGAPPAEASA